MNDLVSRIRVSVVIPTYNRATLLQQAVESILNQKDDDLELIVVDDGSSDDTYGMLAGYQDPRLKVVSAKRTGVPGHVRNLGLQVARGEYIAFLDSDDVCLPTRIQRQATVLDQNPTVGLVCSNARVIDQEGREVGKLYLDADLRATGVVLDQLLGVNFVVNSSAMVRRTLVEKAGFFSESPRLRAVEDYDLWLRIAAISDVVYLPEPLVLYRDHDESLRSGVSRSDHYVALLAALDNLTEFLGEAADGRRELIRPHRAGLLLRLALSQGSERGARAAARSLARAMRCDPRATTSTLIAGSILRIRDRAKQGGVAVVERLARRAGSSRRQP